MEIIKKLYIIFVALSFLSCKKTSFDPLLNNKIEASNKTTNSDYQEVNYVIRKLVNRINVFDFNDRIVTLHYKNYSTLFGISDNDKVKIFSSKYDLDLGEINLLRFDNENSQIYLVELNDSLYKIYNLYIVENNQLYYLGTKDIDLSGETENTKFNSPNLK